MYKYKSKEYQRIHNPDNGMWIGIEKGGIVELNYKLDNPNFELVMDKKVKIKEN
jgi:hypothetical protein